MCSANPAANDPETRAILTSSDVWDLTLPWMPLYWDLKVLGRFRSAGYTFVSLTLQDWPATFEGMRTCVEKFKRIAAETSWLTFADSLEAIEQGRQSGRLMLGVNSQETRLLEEDLTRVEILYQLGVRHMVLAYNVRNLVADGCAERSDSGLSNYGRRVVKEMNRVGVLVDGTHTGRRSSLEAIELSELPVIFSHSNAYTICAHIRNLHDDQIRACAASGGVIGVVGVGAFVGDPHAKTESLFRHIDYIASLVGPEYVGLGTDYVDLFPASAHADKWANERPWPDPLDGWPDPTGTQIPVDESRCFAPEQLSELVRCLLTHGYSRSIIQGILGGNFKRVYATAEAFRARSVA